MVSCKESLGENEVGVFVMRKILTLGVYDYFHIGHLRLFKQCKEHADYLIVAVQNGEYILNLSRKRRCCIQRKNE